MPKFQIETRRGFKYEIDTDDENELDGIVSQVEADEETEFSKSRPLPEGVTPTVESAGGGRGFVSPSLPTETPRMGGRRGGTRGEAKPFVAQGEPELLDRTLPGGQVTPESNQDPMLRSEYVDSVRAKVGGLAPEKRMAELQRMAAGKTVEARAAREALRQVGYEAQRIAPADEELARAIGPRAPAPTTGSGGSKKTSVPSIEPSIRDIEQGQTPAQIAARRDTAAGVADANQGIDAITQRNLRLDAANTSSLRRGADLGVAAAGGAVTGFKLISDAFGAGNQMSQALEGVGNLIDRARSAASVQDDQTIDRLMREAEDGGVGDQVLAAAKAFSVKPAEFIAQGLGTSVPAILAALLPGVRESAIAGIVAATTSGAAMGAGTIKSGIYDEVKKDLRARGMSADEAETRAKAAQAYTGENAGQIAIGTVLGGLASATGQEGVALNMIKRVMGREGAKVAAKEAAGGLIGAALKGGAVEAVPEFLQGGQEQLAKNLALANEGANVPAMRGVFGQGSLEGLAGFGSGAAVSALEYRGTPGQEFAGALNADIAGTAVNPQAIDDQVRRALDPNTQAGAGLIASAARTETNFTPAESSTRAAGLTDIVLPIPEVPDVGVPGAAGAVATGGGSGLSAQPVGGLVDPGPGAAVDGGVGIAATAPAQPGAAGAPVRAGAAGGLTPALTDPVARTSDADLLARVGAPAPAPAAPTPEVDKAAQKDAAKTLAVAQQKAERADSMLRAAEALGEPDTIDVARRVQQRAQADLASAQQQTAALQPKETTAYVPTTQELGAQAREAGAPQGQGQGQATPAGEQGVDRGAGAAADLTGDWQAFAPETGTKAVPRAEMPQIKAEHRGALTQFLGARGVAHEQVEVDPADLKPTQAEFSPAKVAGMAGADTSRSILVSSDGHILDGHHQWLAAKESGQPVKAIRLDAPIDELLPLAREFPSSTLEAGATGPQAQASPARAAAASASLAGPERAMLDGSLRAIERSRNTTYGETSKLALAEDPTPDEQAALAFAEANGVKVAIVEETGKSNFNGAAINGINVLVRGENNDHVLAVAVHEGIHTLDDDIKASLISAIEPTLQNREAFQRVYRYGSGAAARAKMTAEDRAAEDSMITEEMVAMLGQSEAKRPEFWVKLATKMGDTSFGKFARHVLGKIDSMMGKYVAREKIVRDAWTTDLPLVQNALAEAYAGQLKRRGLTKDADRALAQYVSQERAAQFSQRAYHGTPQKGIEKFSTDKIGTGEGAQAYGHGLYFTQKKGIAEWYRSKLSLDRGQFNLVDKQTDQPIPKDAPGYEIVHDRMKSYGADLRTSDIARFQEIWQSDIKRLEGRATEWADLRKKKADDPKVLKIIDDSAAEDAARIEELKVAIKLVAKVKRNADGQLYDVEVPDDSEMLMWDKPLSEQPDQVREALVRMGFTSDTIAAEKLNARLRVLNRRIDRGGSDADEATLEKNRLIEGVGGADPDPSGEEVYRDLAKTNGSNKAASEALAAAGVRGIKYLDGVSRGSAGGSYNFVVFNSDDVEIKGVQFSNLEREHEFEMSTRMPTAVRATEDPFAKLLVADFASAQSDTKWIEATAELVQSYPNYKRSRAKTSAGQLEHLVAHMVDNLLWLHDQVPAETRARSKLWYDGARAITDRWTKRYGATDSQVAGVLAVLSPQKDWFMNVDLARRILDTVTERQAFQWSPQMEATAARIFGKDAYEEDVDAIRGQTLGDLDSDYLRGMWVRVYDQAHNSAAFNIISPEGDAIAQATTKTGDPSRVAWGGVSTIAKAVSILRLGDARTISDALGYQHKVRNFYNNILVPNSVNGHVTIDTHAVAAALLRALSGKSREVLHNFGGGIKGEGGSKSSATSGLRGTYALYEEAYRRAADERGILPREMQSITWEAVRGMYLPRFKGNQKNVDAVDAVWTQYQKGKISHAEARKQVLELSGGIQPPSWSGPDAAAYDADEEADDTGDLSADGVSGADPGTADGGADRDAAGAVPGRGRGPKFSERPSDIATERDADRSTFTPDGLTDLLKAGRWAVLTAEDPGAQKASAEANSAAMQRLQIDLREAGAKVMPAVGKYGDVQGSLIVTNIDEDKAIELGAKYGQESILTRRGLVYMDGRPDTAATGVQVFDAAPDDFYTEIPGTGAFFSVDLDWGDASFSNKPKFVSQLAQSVIQAPAKMDGMPATQWKVWIKSNASKAGVKADEIEWSGIEDYLDMRGGDKLTREEIAGFLGEGGVKVEETVLGARGAPYAQEIRLQRDPRIEWIDDGFHIVGDDGNSIADFDTEDDAERAMGEALGGALGETKYESYRVAGGDNYREVLVTLPSAKNALIKPLADATRAWRGGMEEFGDEDPRTIAAKAERFRLSKEFDKAPANYKSNHWEQPNVLVHFRADDRTDADGNKVLFLHDLQSDWGQGAKKYGFAGKPPRKVTKKEMDDYVDKLFDDRVAALVADGMSKQDAGRKAINENLNDMASSLGRLDEYRALRSDYLATQAGDEPKGVPRAPFISDTKAWVSLGLKRAIMMAVEAGQDRVAVVNGEQAADMFDLSKSLDALEYQRDERGGGQVMGDDSSGSTVVRSRIASDDELEGVVGKEVARKLLEQEPVENRDGSKSYVLTGSNIKVGGEGMKAFYDSIVLQVMRDVAKKLGGRVVESKFDPEDVGINPDDWVGKVKQSAIEITPEMRAKVSAGVPLFSNKPGRLDDIDAYHFSKAQRMSLSGGAYGTGLQGSGRDEYLKAADPRRRQRVYFYVDKGTGINPEAGVGAYAHRATLSNVYDADSDPLGLTKGNQAATETAILDAGFSGYLSRLGGTQSGQVIMLGNQSIKVDPLPAGERPRSGKVVPAATKKAPAAKRSGNELVMRPTADDMVAFIKARKSVEAAAPSFRMEFGEARVKVDQAGAADAAFEAAGSSFRFGPEPVPAAPAKPQAAGLLFVAADTGRVLLLKRGSGVDQSGTWSVVGGAIDAGETPEQAAVREAREEIGFTGDVSPKLWTQTKVNGITYATYAVTVPSEFKPKKNWENSDHGWFEPGALPPGLHPGVVESMKAAPIPGPQFSNKQTETPEFKAWFGDSKVVDEQGKPAVVYHGTVVRPDSARVKGMGDIMAFDRMFTTKFRAPSIDTVGSWFSTNPGEGGAEMYSGSYPGSAIYPAYLSIKDPHVTTFQLLARRARLLASGKDDGRMIGQAEVDAYRTWLKEIGKDGIKIEGSGNDESTEFDNQVAWIALEPEQIKSATGNNGQFDPANPDIRFANAAQDSAGAAPDKMTKAELQKLAPYMRVPNQTEFKQRLQWLSEGMLRNHMESVRNFEIDTDEIALYRRFRNLDQPKFANAAKFGGQELPAETRAQKARRVAQDYFLRTKVVQDVVIGGGGQVGEAQDVYRAEERMYGRVQAQLEDFAKRWVTPMIERAAKAGIDMDELALYAYAKHAPERNVQIDSINPGMQGAGSGMTDADAAQIVSDVQASGKAQQFEDLRQDLLAIAETTRQVLLQDGLITQDEYDAWTGAYQDYVPLRGLENVDEEGRPKPGVGRGVNIRGQESTRALGRRSRAGEIVENIVRDYERAVIRGERNAVAKTFLDLVTTNPDPELWEVNAQKTNRGFSKTLGLVTMSTATETGDDTVGVKVGGQQIYIKVKDQLLVRAMRQAAKDETGEFQSMLAQSLGVYNNWLRNTLTRYNPVFGAVNAVRDLQAGAVASLDKLGARGLKLYAGHYRAALAASVRNEFDALGKQGAVFGDPVMDGWFDEYRRAGGTTAGWFLRDVEDIHTDIRQMLVAAGSAPRNTGERITGSAAWQGAKALLKYVELFGSASENAGRVAAYRAAREMGRSPAESASIAKNLTTNFNRKGEWGTALSSAYLFFNAAVQGTARVLEALKNPRVQALMAGVTGMAATLAVMGAGMGGDDDDGQAYWDKIPQSDKERNLIIMLPPGIQTDGAQKVGGMGRYIKIPMPYGFNVFATLGYTMADVGRNAVDPARGVKPAKAAINMVSAVAGSYNPMGGAFDVTDPVAVGMAIAPTIVDAGIQLGAGVNSFGTPVGPKGSPFDSRPDSERFTVTQGGGAAQRLARWVNEQTGGNRARSGAVDLMPGTIENVVNMAGGGTGRFLMDVFVNVPTKLSGTGDEEAVFRYRDLPFLRNFAGQVDENVDRGLFYERMDEVLKEARTAKNEMKLGIAVKYDPRSRAMQSLGKMADGYSGMMTDLRKEDLLIVNDPSLTAPEKKSMRRDVEKRRNELVREFNKVWIETERDLARGSFDKE